MVGESKEGDDSMGELIFDPKGLGEELSEYFQYMDKFFRSLAEGIPSEYMITELINRGELDENYKKRGKQDDKDT